MDLVARGLGGIGACSDQLANAFRAAHEIVDVVLVGRRARSSSMDGLEARQLAKK